MSQMSQVKRAMITAVCIALCVVLPMAFHSIQNAGAIFCPMHIPVLLCGLLVGWPYGLLCGLAGPLLSSLLTGMPAMGYLPCMMVELGAYGLRADALSCKALNIETEIKCHVVPQNFRHCIVQKI